MSRNPGDGLEPRVFACRYCGKPVRLALIPIHDDTGDPWCQDRMTQAEPILGDPPVPGLNWAAPAGLRPIEILARPPSDQERAESRRLYEEWLNDNRSE